MDVVRQDELLSLPVSSHQMVRLCAAAELSDTSVSSFILQSALAAADQMIDGRCRITVSDSDYLWLLDQIDAPPQDNPRLRKLLAEPTVFDR